MFENEKKDNVKTNEEENNKEVIKEELHVLNEKVQINYEESK